MNLESKAYIESNFKKVSLIQLRFQHCYLEMVNLGYIKLGDKVDLCIPTGNFGNILSATYAKKMDVPYDQIISASNQNKVLHDFFTTGIYDLRDRKLIKTVSPAIDILVSSNLERLLWIHLGPKRVQNLMENLKSERFFQISQEELDRMLTSENLKSGFCDESECKETMTKVWGQDKYMVDPHTAVAIKVAERYKSSNPMLVASTAHYSKFVEECGDVFETIDTEIQNPEKHQEIEDCKQKEIVHKDTIIADYDSVCDKLKDFVNQYFT